MADMYGAVRSNWFRVKDVPAFRTWFYESVRFGFDIDVFTDADQGWAIEKVAFGGYEQYPNAYPRKPCSEDGDYEDWALEEFAVEVRKHLLPGEEFRVLAAGNEKLRYVGATHLVITHDRATFTDLYEGDWVRRGDPPRHNPRPSNFHRPI